MEHRLHRGDLPDDFRSGPVIAIDTETMGLDPRRDRLCLIQLSSGNGTADIVQIERGQTEAPVLARVCVDPDTVKLFHFARFDVAVILQTFGIVTTPIYCTKIASRLARTYTNQHGLKALALECLGEELDKGPQSSDWGAGVLSKEQLNYAAQDVIHLHKLKEWLDIRLEREGRTELAQSCFEFLPNRALLDNSGWHGQDIFAH